MSDLKSAPLRTAAKGMAPRAAGLFAIAIVGIACVGTDILLNKERSHSQSALQHRVELLEEDVSRLEQRVVKLEDVLVEVLSVQTAPPAKMAEAKAVAVEAGPVAELPVSTPPAPPAPGRPVKRKPATRHQAPQGSEYPQMEKPYPWSEWEAPEQQ